MLKVRKYITEQYISREWFELHYGSEAVAVISHVSERLIQRQKKLVAYFAKGTERTSTIERGLVMGPKMLDLLCERFGSDDADEWRGKTVRVYVDESVTFGENQTGGVRMEPYTLT